MNAPERHLRLLTETTAAVNSSLDLEEVLHLVAEKVADALGASIVLVPPLSTLAALSVHRRWRRATPGSAPASALKLVTPAAWLVAASWWGCGVAILATGDSNNALAVEALGMVTLAVTAWIAVRRYGLFDTRQVRY